MADSKHMTVDACACLSIRKVSRAVTQYYDQRLRPSGLRTTQFSVLAVLRSAGAITRTELARRLEMDHSTLTRNLAPLVRKQLVETVPGEDRRTRAVRLTAGGETAFRTALPFWKSAQAGMVEGLGRDGLSHLHLHLARALAVARQFT